MKRIAQSLLILSLLLTGCNEDAYQPVVLASPEDTMAMTASGNQVTLDKEQKEEVALTFHWNDAADRGEGTEITYYFKIDIANNDFATSIPKRKLETGRRSISFTHGELQKLITEQWGKLPGQTVELEAEVIAEVTVYPKFMKPEVTKMKVEVTAYELPVTNLYVLGTATGGKPVQLEMIALNKEYLWKGDLKAGTFKIVESRDAALPSYNKGVDEHTLVYRMQEEEPDALFTVTQTGKSLIYINLENLFISYAYHPCDDVFMIGNATPAGWNINDAPIFTWGGYENPEIFTWEGELFGGEIKFPTEKGNWNPCLMPDIAGSGTAPITNPTFIYYSESDHQGKPAGFDAKWNVTEGGIYRITINMNEVTATFEKQ